MLRPKYLHEMFVTDDSAYDMRNSMDIVMPKYNTVRYGKNSISHAKLWNILNNETIQAINMKTFGRHLLCYVMVQHVLVLTALIAH